MPLHPIPLVDLAMQSLVEGDEEPLALAKGALERLGKKLASFYGKPELHANVAELCMFAVWLGTARESPKLKDALLDLAETAVSELERMGLAGAKAIRDVVGAARRDYSKVTGEVKALLPPKKRAAGISTLQLRGGMARAAAKPRKPKR
jgi:hypothetical protein